MRKLKLHTRNERRRSPIEILWKGIVVCLFVCLVIVVNVSQKNGGFLPIKKIKKCKQFNDWLAIWHFSNTPAKAKNNRKFRISIEKNNHQQ
jgi:hypothetical protein